jgi:hypothetical protein
MDNFNNTLQPEADFPRATDVQDFDNAQTSHALDVVISAAESPSQPKPARPMQVKRFLSGMVFAGSGIGLMLCVAVGALHDAGADGKLSLPAVALCMVIGLMLLGGGFGVMATAAPTFDDDEFARLLRQGNQPLAGERCDNEPFTPSIWEDSQEGSPLDHSEHMEESLA